MALAGVAAPRQLGAGVGRAKQGRARLRGRGRCLRAPIVDVPNLVARPPRRPQGAVLPKSLHGGATLFFARKEKGNERN